MVTPLPYGRAIAHAAGACAIVAVMSLLWRWTAGTHDATLALTTVIGVGALAWIGATLGAAPAARQAGNDNHPFDPLYLDWAPIAEG